MSRHDIHGMLKLDDRFTFYQKYLRIPPSAVAELYHVTASSCSRATRSYQTLPPQSTMHCWLQLWILSDKVAGFCRFLRVYVYTSLCLCVSRPLWSPLIPNLTDLLQRQPLMCAESLSGILDAVSIMFNSYSLIRNALFCFHTGKHTRTYDARIVQQDRWLLCYESVYTFRCVFTSSLFCNFTSLSSFNPILILCKPSNLWP